MLVVHHEPRNVEFGSNYRETRSPEASDQNTTWSSSKRDNRRYER